MDIILKACDNTNNVDIIGIVKNITINNKNKIEEIIVEFPDNVFPKIFNYKQENEIINLKLILEKAHKKKEYEK